MTNDAFEMTPDFFPVDDLDLLCFQLQQFTATKLIWSLLEPNDLFRDVSEGRDHPLTIERRGSARFGLAGKQARFFTEAGRMRQWARGWGQCGLVISDISGLHAVIKTGKRLRQ